MWTMWCCAARRAVAALDGDPDEDPTGDAGRPICGDCARERDFFVMDMIDGELDGNWDPTGDGGASAGPSRWLAPPFKIPKSPAIRLWAPPYGRLCVDNQRSRSRE